MKRTQYTHSNTLDEDGNELQPKMTRKSARTETTSPPPPNATCTTGAARAHINRAFVLLHKSRMRRVRPQPAPAAHLGSESWLYDFCSRTRPERPSCCRRLSSRTRRRSNTRRSSTWRCSPKQWYPSFCSRWTTPTACQPCLWTWTWRTRLRHLHAVQNVAGNVGIPVSHSRIHTPCRRSLETRIAQISSLLKIKDDVRAARPIFHVGVYMDYCSLTPLHHNLYQELPRNTVYRLAHHQFQSHLAAAREFMKSNSRFLQSTACKTDRRHGIAKGDKVAVQHVLVLLFYCNQTKLCTKFRSSYMKQNCEDTDESVIEKHCQNFYWFGRILTEFISFFGTSATKNDPIYTGLGQQFMFHHLSACFEVPTSTTRVQSVTGRFTKTFNALPKQFQTLMSLQYLPKQFTRTEQDESRMQYIFAHHEEVLHE